MPAKPTTQQMGDKHEVFLAQVNGGTKSRASGSQWHDQGDGRNTHDEPFAFCWDGKSTRGQQIAVTLAMIAKIREQAQGERPQIGLRWYGNDALDQVTEDWIAITAADFEELKAFAVRCAELETQVPDLSQVSERLYIAGRAEGENARLHEELEAVTQQRDLEGGNALRLARELESVKRRLEQEAEASLALRRNLEQSRHTVAAYAQDLADRAQDALASAGPADAARQSVESLQAILKAVEADRDRFRELAIAAQKGKLIPGYVPRLPWTVVYQVRLEGRIESSGMHYDAAGNMTPFEVGTVRIERSLGSDNRPRLIVNELRVPDGDLYTDGVLIARACQVDVSIEVG